MIVRKTNAKTVDLIKRHQIGISTKTITRTKFRIMECNDIECNKLIDHKNFHSINHVCECDENDNQTSNKQNLMEISESGCYYKGKEGRYARLQCLKWNDEKKSIELHELIKVKLNVMPYFFASCICYPRLRCGSLIKNVLLKLFASQCKLF